MRFYQESFKYLLTFNFSGMMLLFHWVPSISHTHICRDVQEDGVSEAKDSEAKDDPKMEEQIVGNRNDSTGMNLPKKPGFHLFHDASGPSQSLTSEVPSTAKIALKIKLMFTK